jgi:hypothetical protein
MTITLRPDQEAWLASRVANGDFASVEEGALRLIDERIFEQPADDRGDLNWAKPHIEEHEARMDAVLAASR